jgi:hypothetical protein
LPLYVRDGLKFGSGQTFEEHVFFGSVADLQRRDLKAAYHRPRREPHAVANHLDNVCVWCGADRDWNDAFKFDGAATTTTSKAKWLTQSLKGFRHLAV